MSHFCLLDVRVAFTDVIVFNDETISDQSTFENPEVHPMGINYVLVNGKVAVNHQPLANYQHPSQ